MIAPDRVWVAQRIAQFGGDVVASARAWSADELSRVFLRPEWGGAFEWASEYVSKRLYDELDLRVRELEAELARGKVLRGGMFRP